MNANQKLDQENQCAAHKKAAPGDLLDPPVSSILRRVAKLILCSMDGADNTKTDSKIVFDGMSDFLTVE